MYICKAVFALTRTAAAAAALIYMIKKASIGVCKQTSTSTRATSKRRVESSNPGSSLPRFSTGC